VIINIVKDIKKAEKNLKTILDNGINEFYEWSKPYVAGYFNEKPSKVSPEPHWVAFDNTTADCWVEEFSTEKEAKKYCEGHDEVWDN
jgi:hypothetical protein